MIVETSSSTGCLTWFPLFGQISRWLKTLKGSLGASFQSLGQSEHLSRNTSSNRCIRWATTRHSLSSTRADLGFHRSGGGSWSLAWRGRSRAAGISPRCFLRLLRLSELNSSKTSGYQPTGLSLPGEALHDLDGDLRGRLPRQSEVHVWDLLRASVGVRHAHAGEITRDRVPDSHRMTHHGDRIIRLYQTAHANQPAGRLSKEFLLSQGTKKDKKVLTPHPSTPSSTVTTHPDEFIHYREPRNITVREMARLQSFPDDFEFRGRYTINGPRRRFDVARCSQVGNAGPAASWTRRRSGS